LYKITVTHQLITVKGGAWLDWWRV